MMRDLGIRLNVEVSTSELIERLKVNKQEHKRIHVEAVEGFKDHAMQCLKRIMEQCTGREDVFLRIEAPKDYGSAYESAIAALEMHQGETIELDASTFRKLAEDKWDWMDDWLLSNSTYSALASAKLEN